MKIAICDDEQIFINQLKEQINKASKNKFNVSIEEFLSGEELIENFVAKKYDIIILDIEMKKLNGIETAKKIRKMDRAAIIAFVTSYQEFAIKGYEVNAFRYILKGQPDAIYQKQLNSIFDEYAQNHRTLSVPYKDAIKEILISDIIYFEVYKRMIIVHTISEDIQFYGTLNEIENNSSIINFVKPYKSYYINLAYIDTIDKNAVLMKNNIKIPLSRRFKQNATNTFLKYITER